MGNCMAEEGGQRERVNISQLNQSELHSHFRTDGEDDIMTGSSRQVPLFTPNIQKTLVCVNTADYLDFVDKRRHHFHIQLGNHSESESSRATETIYWNQRAIVNLGQPLNKPFK